MDGLKVLSVLSISLTLAIFGFGCKETQSPELEALKDLFFDLQVGEVTIQTELAILPEERHKGLMHREIGWKTVRECFSFLKTLLHNVFG